MSRRSDLAGWSLLIGLMVATATGCASAPDAWQLSADHVSETACGGWSKVTLESDRTISGELLAVDASLLYVHDGEALYSIPGSQIDRTVTFYADSWDGTIGAWTAGGAASTIAHGFTLLFSGPIWLATGLSAMAAEQSTGRQIQAIPHRKRARFPQGLPASFRKVADQLEPNTVDSVEAPELAGGCPPEPKQ